MKLGIFIFRRDLRMYDNTALIAALKDCDRVIPIFIFDPVQVGQINRYRSNNCIQFMIESLTDLADSIPLQTFNGNPVNILAALFDRFAIAKSKPKNELYVYVNQDYTPYSKQRDSAMEKLCNEYGIQFHSFEDILLQPVSKVKSKSGNPFVKFTPYYNASRKFAVAKPVANLRRNYYRKPIRTKYNISLHSARKFYNYQENAEINVRGGRSNAIKILQNLDEFRKYNQTRNLPAIPTTHLSAYNKFGCLSIREVYWAAKRVSTELVRQLYWRDFYYQVMYHYPDLVGHSFKRKYDKLEWNSANTKVFAAWKEGRTGFPLIDAAMRQLNQTGFMHNRCRMIVASFLVKDLHIDWREGERYFSQKLVDIDLAQNNGNWQNIAATGADVQPYFRVFNPWLQSKKYDPECEYIKKWLPKLRDVPAKQIHEWYKYYDIKLHPAPIIDHEREKKKALRMYSQ